MLKKWYIFSIKNYTKTLHLFSPYSKHKISTVILFKKIVVNRNKIFLKKYKNKIINNNNKLKFN